VSDAPERLPGTFPGGYKHPPAHPNCRCVLVAWRVEWDEDAPAAPAPRSADTPPTAEQRKRMLENSLEADRMGDEFEETARVGKYTHAEVRDSLGREGVPGAQDLPDDLPSAISAYKRHLFQRFQDADAATERGDIKPVPALPSLRAYKNALERGAREVSRAAQDADRLQREILEEVSAINGLHAKLVDDDDDVAISDDADEEFAVSAGHSLQASRGLSRSASGAKLKDADMGIDADTLELYGEIGNGEDRDEEDEDGARHPKELRAELDERLERVKERLPRLAEAQATARNAMKKVDDLDWDDAAEDLDPENDAIVDEMVAVPEPSDRDDATGERRSRYEAAREAARTTLERERARELEIASQWTLDEALDSASDAEKATKRLIKKLDKYKPPEPKEPADEDED
jgi:hypothetical protein